jgi:translation initiation factor 2 beta subunit (eIF-2beta)/eIF-5
MDPKRRSVVERLRRYGLRVVCASCGTEQRHLPQSGRLRKAACSRCGQIALRPVHWVKLMPDRWEQLVKERRTIRAPFER